MAIFYPSKYTVEYTGGTFTLNFIVGANETPATDYSIIYIDNDGSFNVDIVNYNETTCTMEVTVEPNEGTVQRTLSFSLMKFTANGAAPARYIYSFTVAYNPSKLLQPIWQDTYFFQNNLSQLDYTIVDEEGVVVYSGKTVAEPGTLDIKFNLNRICSNYLNSNLLNGITPGVNYIYDYSKRFMVQDNNDNALAQYRFYNSYAYEVVPSTVFLNDPIKRKVHGDTMEIEVDSRQYSFVSAFNKDSNPRTLTLSYMSNKGLQRIDYEIDNTAMLVRIGRGLEVPDATVLPQVLLFYTTNGADGDIHLTAVDTCYEYCLYYCNAFGGWDSLLIKGNTLKTDNVESHYYTKGYDNTTTDFEKKKYTNLITTTYRLHTDWFTDDEQSRLYHLLESNEVYLHNLVTDKIEPVNITNKSVEYKTFTNNGKKKWYNTIDVEVAQTKIRK